MTESDKHTSLLRDGDDYSFQKFYNIGPRKAAIIFLMA